MAVSVALYALGVSLQSRPHAGSSALIPIAIVFGSVATLIFACDVAYLIRRDVQRRRALRTPPAAYGRLDYVPEFTSASQRYVDAQGKISEATANTAEVFRKNQAMTSQAEADECGRAAQQLSGVFAQLLPAMNENGKVARQCLRGLLRSERPANEKDAAGLRELRASTRYARTATSGYLDSIRQGREATLYLRKRNLSRSLNESVEVLEAQLKEAAEIARVTVRGFRAAERHMTRRLFSFRSRSLAAMARSKVWGI